MCELHHCTNLSERSLYKPLYCAEVSQRMLRLDWPLPTGDEQQRLWNWRGCVCELCPWTNLSEGSLHQHLQL